MTFDCVSNVFETFVSFVGNKGNSVFQTHSICRKVEEDPIIIIAVLVLSRR